MSRLQRIEQAIGTLRGALPEQKQTLQHLASELPALRSRLASEITAINESCLEAKVEENDYTVLTYDDLEYELGLAEASIRKKLAFVDNQVSGVGVGHRCHCSLRRWFPPHIRISRLRSSRSLRRHSSTLTRMTRM